MAFFDVEQISKKNGKGKKQNDGDGIQTYVLE